MVIATLVHFHKDAHLDWHAEGDPDSATISKVAVRAPCAQKATRACACCLIPGPCYKHRCVSRKAK